MKKIIRFKCPCCDELISVSLDNGTVLINEDNQELSEDNISQVLKELNIEFG